MQPIYTHSIYIFHRWGRSHRSGFHSLQRQIMPIDYRTGKQRRSSMFGIDIYCYIVPFYPLCSGYIRSHLRSPSGRVRWWLRHHHHINMVAIIQTLCSWSIAIRLVWIVNINEHSPLPLYQWTMTNLWPHQRNGHVAIPCLKRAYSMPAIIYDANFHTDQVIENPCTNTYTHKER